MNTPRRIAHFLAQIHEESGGFTRFTENLNYSPQGLIKTFGTNQISVAQANLYGRTAKHKANQEAIANIVYGGNWGKINLGNTQVGDGWRFRGRGLMQLTGRANYQAYKNYSRHDVIANPNLASRPDIAIDIAGWFWSVRFNLNPIADTNNINTITKKINGGLTNLQERVKQLNYYITIDTLGILKKKVKQTLLPSPIYNFWSGLLHLDK
ncbi:glycoside hydrolase family 19 protein [Flavobacterium aquatile]|uniref:glycoside hydrolase family 19 protein n=1 Tax=Flavobacterium aquatile TaxID=245 RepID=UPI0013FDED0F|nr:glycoside hydrolase family 19 protein [Flavobacterium aquatile]